jgi:hypothetical protein
VGDFLLPGLDTFLLVVPILAVLAVWMFGLDERIAKPGRTPKPRRSFCGLAADGSSRFSDPDGKPCRQGLPRPMGSGFAHPQASGTGPISAPFI